MNVADMIDLFRIFVSEDVDPEDKRETAVYWKTGTIISLLNLSQDYCLDKISRVNQSYFISIYESTGSNEYLLPEDFLRAMEVRVDNRRLEPVDLSYGLKTEIGGAILNYPFLGYYYFKDNKLILPKGAKNLKLTYIRKLPKLVNRLDISQIPAMYHEYMVMYAVLAASEIDEAFNLSQLFVNRFKTLELNMLGGINDRQVQEPRYVHPDFVYM